MLIGRKHTIECAANIYELSALLQGSLYCIRDSHLLLLHIIPCEYTLLHKNIIDCFLHCIAVNTFKIWHTDWNTDLGCSIIRIIISYP